MREFLHMREERLEGHFERLESKVEKLFLTAREQPRIVEDKLENKSRESDPNKASVEVPSCESECELRELALRQLSSLESISKLLECMPADLQCRTETGLRHCMEEAREVGRSEQQSQHVAIMPRMLNVQDAAIFVDVVDEGDQDAKELAGDEACDLSSQNKVLLKRASDIKEVYCNGGNITTLFSSSSDISWSPGKIASPRSLLKWVDCASMIFIFLNTIYLAFEAEVRMRSAMLGKYPPVWLWWGNVVFAVAFVIELLGRALLLGRGFFDRRDFLWNVYDACLVVGCIVDLVFEVLNVSLLRGLRVVRAMRASRAVQTIHHVQHLRLMVASIISSLPSLAWALVLLMLSLYLFALLIMHGVEDHFQHVGPDRDLMELYGNLGVSMLTLFMAISGGKDWGECVDPLWQVSPLYVVFFVGFVAFVVFGVVNILTAVFIEASSRIIDIDTDLVVQRHRDARESTMMHLQQLFADVDTEKTGRISKEQMFKLFKNQEALALLETLSLDTGRVGDLVRLMDLDHNDEVDIGEFIIVLMRVRGWAKGVDVAAGVHENKQLFTNLTKELRKVTCSLETLQANRLHALSGCTLSGGRGAVVQLAGPSQQRPEVAGLAPVLLGSLPTTSGGSPASKEQRRGSPR